MNRMLRILLVYLFGLSAGSSSLCFAQSLQEIQEYCQSMHGGMTEEDARAYIEECINEQKGFIDQETSNYPEYSDQVHEQEQYTAEEETYSEESYTEESYQEPVYEQDTYTPDTESQEQDCYSRVDEQIQKLLDNDPNASFDYDQMLEQCLKGNI
jgi:hypothetical protein